jgi:predicted outer membrane repeat protein
LAAERVAQAHLLRLRAGRGGSGGAEAIPAVVADQEEGRGMSSCTSGCRRRGTPRRSRREPWYPPPLSRLLLSVGLGAIASAPAAQAHRIRVPADCSTIQAGIDAAADGDTVLVAAGAYAGEGNTDLGFGGRRIVVTSERGPGATSIVCDESSRGVSFKDGETAATLFAGFTVRGASIAGYGGGVFCSGASPTIRDCRFVGDFAKRGGAIYCKAGSPLLIDCEFVGCGAADFGGAICCEAADVAITACVISANAVEEGPGGGIYCFDAPVVVSACTIARNRAGRGGALYCEESDLLLTGCLVEANRALGGELADGGGVCCVDSAPLLSHTLLLDNLAERNGGGVYGYRARPALRNVVLAGNEARRDGGGLCCYWTDLTLDNCTITGNPAVYDGGGVALYYSTPSLRNSILWGDLPDEIYTFQCEAPATYCDIEGGWAGVGNIDAPPLFAQLRGFRCLLRPGSPGIDQGDPGLVDGVDWPEWYGNGSRSDMGAYGGPECGGWRR